MFLIEDKSTETLVRIIMNRIVDQSSGLTYDCKSFRGIGGFAKKKSVSDIKTGKLLNDLRIYLKGFDNSLRNYEAAIIVVVDNDDKDPQEFRQQMQKVADEENILIDHVFCLAVEEMEAWLLGDYPALKNAYPKAKNSVFQKYEQDSICGTWELLADVIYPGGYRKLSALPYGEIGKIKSEWAEKIGMYMDPNENRSPSFQNFMNEIKKRIPQAAA